MSAQYAASFTGSNSYLSITNYTGNPTAFSVSCWANLNANQVSRCFFSDYNTSSGNGWVVGISDSTNNKLKFYLGSNTLSSNTILSNSTWYHLVFVYDGSKAYIYINGSSTPDSSLTSSISYGSTPASNWMGTLQGTSQLLNGSLAAMGYWSKALSTAEISTLYNTGKGLSFADLSGTLLTSLGSYHDFKNSSNLGLDSSSNSRNYTNTNVSRIGGPDAASASGGTDRVSQMGAMALYQGTPKARISQEGLLVIVPTYVTPKVQPGSMLFHL